MRIASHVLLFGVLPITSHALRGADHKPRRLKQTVASSCTFVVAKALAIDPDNAPLDETSYECEMDSRDTNGKSGQYRKIKASEEDMASLKEKFESGELVSGEYMIDHGSGVDFDDEDIFIPPGLLKKSEVFKRDRNRRHLAVVNGDKPILVVRVTDSVGKAHPRSAAQMGDDVFGTLGDPNNLKSQLYDCSNQKLNVLPGDIPEPAVNQAAPGVTEVTISVTLEGNSRSIIRNAVTNAVNAKLGINLPGPYQQVMYNLEGCYVDCGWAAYAYINSWNSVYQGNYYYMTGVQVHELGHNFNLAHSGGLNGATYTDHTGMMGNPLYSDDVGKMCYNAAKNWQLDWYEDDAGSKKLLDPSGGSASFSPTELTMVGIAEYAERTDTANQPVTVKLETGTTTDYFIGFNRATGANAQNDEADDEITITTSGSNGEGYSQSFLKAHLVKGESYTIPNFASSGQNLVIKAEDINIGTVPRIATVCVAYEGESCAPVEPTNPPTPPPTSAPVPTNPPTTAEPTPFPTPPPTSAPVPTNPPTTAAPTTAKPTSSPTQFNCGTINSKGSCNNDSRCTWDGNPNSGECISSGGGGGGPSPTPPPTPPTGTGCATCGNGDNCCAPQSCETSGPKSRRACV